MDVQKILLLAVLSGNNPFKKKDSDLCAYLSVSRGGGHEQLISNGGRFKPAFAERDKCKPVLRGLSLAENLVKPLLSLYGIEWRERGYGLRGHTDIFCQHNSQVTTVKSGYN